MPDTPAFHRQAPQPADSQIVVVDQCRWDAGMLPQEAIAALEAGKVLHFPHLEFPLEPGEGRLLTPAVRHPDSRNISLGADARLKGAAGDHATLADLERMIARFSRLARELTERMLPRYRGAMRLAPTSYRPMKVEGRAQSWRADDRRLHVDAFPSRPNYGERILRVFTNVNPDGEPRVWRIGEPFETVARHFLPRTKPYSAWQARALRALRITKSLRSEYDHCMLQLHDAMKADMDYQKSAPQATVPFASGSTWICFSDQVSHAVMSGQHMLEQTLHLAPKDQYDRESSPLAILTRLAGHPLV